MSSDPTVGELRALLTEFEPGRGHLMPALHKVQDTYGWISRPAIDAVARQLKTTPALVYGSITYYYDFLTHPPPEREIAWCSGPACRLRGGDRIREALQHTLELPLGGVSPDGKYGFHNGQCIGTCHEAPQVWLDGKIVGNLTVSKAIELGRRVRGSE